MTKLVFAFTLALLFVTGSGVLASGVKKIDALAVPEEQYGLLSQPFREGTLIFVPDIMLGRGVETLMEEKGVDAPFRAAKKILEESDVAIGNFEAAVPERHTKTKNNTLRFSVREEYLAPLRNAGFDVLSLANNHSFDYGTDGYEHTKYACERNGLLCAGHSNEITYESVVYKNVGDVTVAILMLNALEKTFKETAVEELLNRMNESSDVQFVFVHWGEEYTSTHTDAQESLARALIDRGVDAIIGHHPHVTQDVDEYRGKPIFYSLGNFIFDQYWGKDVQEGYAVRVTLGKKTVTYEILPYTMNEPSVPQFLNEDEQTAFFKSYEPNGPFKDGVESYVR